MNRPAVLRLIGLLLITLVFAPSLSQAARIRVSQESYPGAGDFDKNLLGTVEAMDFSRWTASEVYAYGESYSYSYGERGPRLRDDTSHVFFARTVEGLVLFIVHDRPDNPDGGVAVMRLKIEGEAKEARILFYDDPYGQRDTYESVEEERLFISRQLWNSCCTDGMVLGPLNGLWRVFAEFPEEDELFGTRTISGLQSWTVLSADGSEVPLHLQPGRRVRLDPVRSLAQGETADSLSARLINGRHSARPNDQYNHLGVSCLHDDTRQP